MADSKVKLTISLEGEGECIERLADILERFFQMTKPQSVERFASGDPKDFHFQPVPRRTKLNGH